MQRRLTPMLALALALGCAGPAAAQVEGPTPLQRMLGNLGILEIPSDDPIEYRERAPLVVPPSSDLPLPRAPDDVRAAHPDWPADPDVQRQRAQREFEKLPIDQRRGAFYSGRILTQEEIRRGTSREAQRPSGIPATPELTAGREMQAQPRGLLGWIRGGGEQPVQFTGEPPRTRLVDPPAGYLTPSPNAPYGVVGKEKYVPRVGSPFDRLLVPGDPAGPR
jgi:hypothetical protein